MEPTKPDVEFIRLFFPSPAEEVVAVRLAVLLASVVGERVTELRPNIILAEIFAWTEAFDTVEFVMELEDILGEEMEDAFAVDLEQRTFRNLVEYVSHRT